MQDKNAPKGFHEVEKLIKTKKRNAVYRSLTPTGERIPKLKVVPKKEVRKAITNNSTHATLAQVVTPGAVSQSRLFCHFVVAILMMTSAQGTISFLVC